MRILIILFFFSSSLLAQNSNIEVEYIQAIGKYKGEEFDTPKTLKGVLYILKANAYSSEFRRHHSMLDSEIPLSNKRFVRGYGAKGVFYKNIKTREKIRKAEVIGKETIITYPYNEFKWEIEKEQKQIGKYRCYKAISIVKKYDPRLKKEFSFITTAWFTPEIPLPFGPKNYDGLPGLILEIEIFDNYFIANTIKFLDEELQIEKPEAKKTITLNEYVEMSSKLFNN